MNYFVEIKKLVDEFCATTPAPDNSREYLDAASEVSKLNSEAIFFAEEGVDSNDERVIKIYEELKKIME